MWQRVVLVGSAPLAFTVVCSHTRQHRFAPLHASCESSPGSALAPAPGAKLLLVQVVFRCV